MMNSNYLENNIKALTTNHKELAEKLCRYHVLDDDFVKIFPVGEKSILTIRYQDKYIQLDSLYDSEIQVKTLIDALSDGMSLGAKLVMFGLGNGMYAKYFLEKVTSDHEIFVVEPSMSILKTALENYDLSDVLKNNRFHISVIEGKNETAYRDYFSALLIFTDLYSIRYTVYTGYQVVFESELECWMNQMNHTFNMIGSERKLYRDYGRTFVVNNYACFPYVAKSKSLKKLIDNMPEDIPAIIVSAGPSLSKNIKELRKAKGKSVLIAVDAAVNPMLRNGIVPDLMVSVDPIKGAEYVAEEGAEFIPLVCGMNSGAALTRAHKGVKLYVSDMNPFLESFFYKACGTLLHLETGGSVSTSAFHLAYLLKCRTIILVGQDLAYTGNKSHAENSVRGSESLSDIYRIDNVKKDVDVYGDEILTSEMFLMFKYWFEDRIKRNAEINVIDATEGGVLIKGSSVKTLKDAIENECVRSFNFSEILDKTGYLLDDKQAIDFKNYIDNLPNELNKVIIKINEGLKHFSVIRRCAVKGKLASKELKTSSKRSNEILDEIQGNYCLEYVKYLIQEYTDELLKTINNINKDVKKELIEISDIGIEYLNELKKEINSLNQLIDDCKREWNINK